MQKKELTLTVDQKDRGIIFSSQLQPDGKIHEIHKDDNKIKEIIERLRDDSFFDNSLWKYNEIRS